MKLDSKKIAKAVIEACKESTEPSDTELNEIEGSLDDMFSISEDEYDDMFGDMPDLDKGLHGAKWRERKNQMMGYYNGKNDKMSD